ncbi:MAG: glycosyltransferase family 4 protein [Emcibacteraceae bacterium]|nr:glycosyltransferase family 4 protein [Emcibacteraceae bacterium]
MKTKINIFTTAKIPHVGGMSTHIEGIVAYLRKSDGFEVDLFSRAQFGNDQAKASSGGSRTRSFISYLIFVAVLIIVTSIRYSRRKANLNIFHDCYAIIASRRVKGKKILYFHGELANELLALGTIAQQGGFGYRLFLAIEKYAIRRADTVIAVDTRLQKYLEKVHNVNAIVKHNFVTETLNHHVEKFDVPRIILSRRLVEKNGVVFALQALSKVNQLETQFVVDVFGSGQLEAELRSEFGKHSWLNFMGDITNSELRQILPKYWATIVPSIPVGEYVEATSISALEAMCDGTLVLASNVGGLAELIQHGVDGVLFEPKSAANITSAISEVQSQFNYDTLTLNAQLKIRKSYSIDQYVDFLLEFNT